MPILKILLKHWRWYLRIFVLYALFSSLTPPRARVRLDAPQTVETVHEHVCVHTRLIDEVEEWVIQESLRRVREMGADTIVEFFPWAYIESVEGQYNWNQADKIMRHAENQGIRVIARLGFVPYWARPEQKDDWTTLNYLPEESYDDFARYAAAFARRYSATVQQIILWNEPNLSFEWGYRPVNPAEYTDLLRVVYPVVKAANPTVEILAGALAPTLEAEGSPHGLSDLLYLEQMYQAGAADYFDALAVHTYGFTQPADAEPQAEMLNFRRAELLHDIMLRYDAPDTPVYITETGWNDHPRWTLAVRPSQRIAYTLEAFRYAESNWTWARKVCLWVLRYPAPSYSYPDNFTLLTTDFQAKPLYFAIQAYARGQVQSEDLWLAPPSES